MKAEVESALAEYRAQQAAGNATPSVRAIARKYGVSDGAIRRHLNTREGQQVPHQTWPVVGPSMYEDRLVADPDRDIEIPVIHRDYTNMSKLNVYPLGDVHKGSKYHAETRWHEWLDYLSDTDGVSMLGTGDFFNAAIVGSKSDIYGEKLTVQQARHEITAELSPLARQGKLDLLMPGNHEDRIYRATGDDPVAVVSEVLGTNYTPDIALVVYHVGDQEYLVYVRHGTGNYPAKVGTQLNQLYEGALVIEADIHVSGHTHAQAVGTADQFRYNRETNRVERHAVKFMSSGSFLNYERYAAVKGYHPTRIGAPRIFLDGTRKDFHVSV